MCSVVKSYALYPLKGHMYLKKPAAYRLLRKCTYTVL